MGPVEPVVVALDGSGDYLDLQSARLKKPALWSCPVSIGDEAIVFVTPGTQVEGIDAETVRFVQTNNEQDLFVVRADDVTTSSVSLDTSTAGQAAFVEQAMNRVVLQDSIISGGDQIFTIYFAGPEVAVGPQPSMPESQNSRGNRLLRNVINTTFVGDSVAFALQADGEVRENIINGGMLSMYMLQNVLCEGNTVLDSPTNGIFISLSSRTRQRGNVVRNSGSSHRGEAR